MQSAKAQEQLLREHLQQITMLLKAVQNAPETEPHALLLMEVSGDQRAADGRDGPVVERWCRGMGWVLYTCQLLVLRRGNAIDYSISDSIYPYGVLHRLLHM